jgi:hypothetical protein
MSQEQIATLLYVIAIVGGALSVVAVALLWKEYKTLRNEIEGDHITASVRAAFKAQPGAFLIVILTLSILLAYLGGHLLWP